jgi:hypothetical protein
MKNWIHLACHSRVRYFLFAVFVMLLGFQVAVSGAEGSSLLTPDTGWNLPVGYAQGRLSIEAGTLEIRGLGELSFDPAAITTLRPDIFLPGHFSVFDVLVHLSETNGFELEFSFDEELQTHVIHSLSGLSGWWYDAHYEGGSFDKSVVRMDQFPVKDGMNILLYLEDPARLEAIHQHFQEEVSLLADNDGLVIIPTVTLLSSTATVEFSNVVITGHDTRADVFQPGVITMLDVLLSLGDQGDLLQLGLDWRKEDGDILVVDGYYVTSIQAEGFAPETTGSCVLTHQLSGVTIAEFLSPHTHTMSHIHLTADLEILVSPESVEWLWICL